MNLLCILPLSVCSHPEDWRFVQSVGGLELAAKSVSEGVWSLAVRANVSGLEEITAKPTVVNSALICESTTASVEGSDIYLTINTGVVRDGYTRLCPSANLGKVDPGNYQVLYRSPNGESQALGQVTLSSSNSRQGQRP